MKIKPLIIMLAAILAVCGSVAAIVHFVGNAAKREEYRGRIDVSGLCECDYDAYTILQK